MISLRRLPNQERDETTVLFLRRHWIFVAKIVLVACVMAAIPAALYVLLLDSGAILDGYFAQIGVLFFSIYLLYVIGILMTMFTDYYLDTWIVTTNRAINIEQNGLFSRTLSELHLNQVQDVTAETIGFLPTILSYGDVYIQTAGTRERFLFKSINNPEDVKRTIARLVAEDKIRHGDASRATL